MKAILIPCRGASPRRTPLDFSLAGARSLLPQTLRSTLEELVQGFAQPRFYTRRREVLQAPPLALEDPRADFAIVYDAAQQFRGELEILRLEQQPGSSQRLGHGA